MTSRYKETFYSLFLLLALTSVFTACKVSYSFSGARVSADASSFSVDYFQNRASIVQPTLSQEITDGLIDQIKTQTSLEYSTEQGDLTFTGEITDYSTKPLTASANNQAATNRFTITVSVKHENTVEPELSFEQSFTRYEDYSSEIDFSSVEAELSEEIVTLLLEDIFNKAFVTW